MLMRYGVVNHDTAFLRVGELTLAPGLNVVDAETYYRLQHDPAVESWCAEGRVEFIGEVRHVPALEERLEWGSSRNWALAELGEVRRAHLRDLAAALPEAVRAAYEIARARMDEAEALRYVAEMHGLDPAELRARLYGA